MRILVIGHSHLAALMMAWQGPLASDFPGVHLEFYGAPGINLNRLSLVGNSLVPGDERLAMFLKRTSGRESATMSLVGWDAVVLHGHTDPHQSLHVARLLSRDDARHAKPRFMSDAFLRESARALIANTAVAHVGDLVATTSQQRIVATPVPLVSEAIYDGERAPDGLPAIDLTHGRAARFLERLAEVISEYCGQRAFTWVPQWTASMVRGGFTHSRFTAGAVELTAALDEQLSTSDMCHMNAAYGEGVLRDVLSAIGASSRTTGSEITTFP